MTLARYLWIFGSIIVGTLGTIHLIYTFFTNRFLPVQKNVMEEMRNASPNLSTDLSMWKAWIGFNASHSAGLIFIAVVNCFLVLKHFSIVQKSHFYFLFNIVTIAFYVFLAKKYWFTPPLVGGSIALLSFTVAYILTIANK